MPALTISNIPELYPEVMAEYQRVTTQGDPKLDKRGNPIIDRKTGQPVMEKYKGTWEKWAAEHSKVDPNWLANANNDFQQRMRDDVDFRMERMQFTPDTLAEIEEFFPEAVEQYDSLKANGKIRDKTFTAYAQRMVKSDPSWLPAINAQYRNVVTNEIDSSLLELRKDPAFAKLPEDIQRNLASRVITGGLDDASAYARRDPTINSNADVMAWVNKAETESKAADMPFEEQFFNQVVDDYVQPDMARDAQRRQEADSALAGYKDSFDAGRQLIGDMTKVDPTTGGSNLYTQELTKNQAAVDAQLGTLGDQMTTMRGSLDSEVAARQAGLNTQISALDQGLTTLNDAQKAALSDEVAAKRAAIEAELSTMGQAITQQDVDRRAALETQLGELNTAQDKVDTARLDAARSQGTAINLGAQAEMDRTRANMAQQGYVGGSSGSDMALGRSLIQARQGAAQAVADAGLTNSLDRQKISNYGADTRFGIADSTAGMRYDLTNYGATENRGLTDYGAEQTRGLASTDAKSRFDLTSFGASERRGIGDYGAAQGRQLTDFGATETRNIKDSGTQRGLDYFDRDVARRIASLSLPAEAMKQEFQVKNMADDYAQSGLNRSMRNLDWFNIGSSQAPGAITPGYTPNTTMGDAFQNLGAGIVGATTQFGLAKLYQGGGSGGSAGGVGAKTTYADFLKNNPNSSAATGGS